MKSSDYLSSGPYICILPLVREYNINWNVSSNTLHVMQVMYNIYEMTVVAEREGLNRMWYEKRGDWTPTPEAHAQGWYPGRGRGWGVYKRKHLLLRNSNTQECTFYLLTIFHISFQLRGKYSTIPIGVLIITNWWSRHVNTRNVELGHFW